MSALPKKPRVPRCSFERCRKPLAAHETSNPAGFCDACIKAAGTIGRGRRFKPTLTAAEQAAEADDELRVSANETRETKKLDRDWDRERWEQQQHAGRFEVNTRTEES